MTKVYVELETKLLYRFLKRNNALKQYIDNTIEHRSKYPLRIDVKNVSFMDILREYDMSEAFPWTQSKEGYPYWAILNARFYTLIREIREEIEHGHK